VRVSLKAVNGVESVDVSLNKGLATVTLKSDNNVTMPQLQEAIARNGFITKQSTVTARGTLLDEGGSLKLKVSGSNEIYILTPDPQAKSVDINQMLGQTVTVDGVVPEAAKGKTPDTIQFRSIIQQ
jgi:heavy-metal-associated domain-containing protein